MNAMFEGLGWLFIVATVLLIASVCHGGTYDRTWGRIGDYNTQEQRP